MLKSIFSLFLSLANTGHVVHKDMPHFDHRSFLTSWDTNDFEMEKEIDAAFKRLRNNLQEMRDAKQEVINGDDATLHPLINKSLISTHIEEESLKKLSSTNLVLGQIRIRYPLEERRGHATAYVQLENSFCWHTGDFAPTFYLRNEEKLLKQSRELKKIIPQGKKPCVTVYPSRKIPVSYSLFKSRKILYSLDLDFTQKLQ